MHGIQAVDWSDARWLNPPPSVATDGTDLIVTTGEQTDFWRTTSYGFVHANGHALLIPLPVGAAVEVSFVLADFTDLYDQAGAMLWVDQQTWIKAGVELTDGAAHLGAVVTRGHSDWSAAPVPGWAGHEVTVRMSRAGDAVTVRAQRRGLSWQFVRLAPLDPSAAASAGPFCCSPTREALNVRFTRFSYGPADTALHLD